MNFDFSQFTRDDKIKLNIVKVGSTPGLAAIVEARRHIRKHLKSAVILKNEAQPFLQVEAQGL